MLCLQAYTDEKGGMTFEKVDGSSLVTKMSEELGRLLSVKMASLQVSFCCVCQKRDNMP